MAKKFSPQLLVKLKKKLLEEDGQLARNIEELRKDDPFLDPDHVNDNAAVDTDVREQMGHDTIEAQIISLTKRQERVQMAFKKMEKQAYGICENCGEMIPEARLELVPEARYCIECERKLVK